jgi:hypothetical protein
MPIRGAMISAIQAMALAIESRVSPSKIEARAVCGSKTIKIATYSTAEKNDLRLNKGFKISSDLPHKSSSTCVGLVSLLLAGYTSTLSFHQMHFRLLLVDYPSCILCPFTYALSTCASNKQSPAEGCKTLEFAMRLTRKGASGCTSARRLSARAHHDLISRAVFLLPSRRGDAKDPEATQNKIP